MPAHERRDDRARRVARRQLEELGREIRNARLDHDLSQAVASHAIGRSTSAWSRLERGEAVYLPLIELVRAAAVVGLDISARAYPGGSPLRDAAHVRLLERFRQRLGPGVQWRTEVPLPRPGDRRAWDAVVRASGVVVGIEAETRARDAQAMQRRLELKRRDGGVDHLLLLLRDSRHNRTFLRSVGEAFLQAFPIPGDVALQRLGHGQDPGGSAIVRL